MVNNQFMKRNQMTLQPGSVKKIKWLSVSDGIHNYYWSNNYIGISRFLKHRP